MQDVDGVAPVPRSRRLRHGWVLELLGGVVVYFVYDWLREQATGASADALRHAKDIVSAEQFLGLYHERAIQEAFLDHGWFLSFWNIYYGTIHFVLPVVALVWLYRAWPARYLLWRNTLLFMLGFALIGFVLYPLTPPRLMPGHYGFVDTAADYFNFGPQVRVKFDAPGGSDASAVEQFGNLFAAMPSLHVGWSTWVAFALWPVIRRWWGHVLLALYPVTILFCIVVTANHWLLDAVGGWVVLALGYWSARRGCGVDGWTKVTPAGTIRDVRAERGGTAVTLPQGFPNEEHLALAFDAGRLGMWSWNALTDEITWDDALQERFGLVPTPGTLTFGEYLALVHPDDRELTTSTVEAARLERRDFRFEHRAVWPDGSVHWLEGRGRSVYDDRGEFVGMIGVAIDIDDRKLVDEIQREADALRANAELVQQLEDAQRLARIGSWRWEFESDLLELSTEMHRQLRGASAPRTGQDLIELFGARVHPDDRAELQQIQRRSVIEGKPYTVEHRLVVEGRTRHIVHRGELVRDEDGTVTGLRGTTQDITDQRRAEQTLVATRDRLAREQRAVEVLQEALLSSAFPEVDHFEIAARYLSAETEAEIGGDWYDAFALPDGRVMLAVGDVSGHGIRAARLMAKFRHATRAYAILEPDPAAVLVRLDAFASYWGEPEEFATMQLAALDPSDGTIELVSAGHPAPLVVGRNVAGLLEVDGTRALGLTSHPLEVPTTRLTLDPATALLFYTDGLVERRGSVLESRGDGTDELAGLSIDTRTATAGAVCDAAIARCLHGLSREDDVCVLAIVRCA